MFTSFQQNRTQKKKNKHTPYGYSLFTHCYFDNNKSKHDFHKGVDSMKKFCADLRKHATEIINCDKREMLPLIEEEEKLYKGQKGYHICKQEFNYQYTRDEIIAGFRIMIIIRGYFERLPIVSVT